MNLTNKKIILGASDAVIGNYCSKLGADYVWASSFIMSAMLGKKDDGIIDIEYFLPIIKAIIIGSFVPVILDFDIGGRDIPEYKKNLNLIKKINLGGVCMEDESWPKFNAMIKAKSRKLISPKKMAEKIAIARYYLGKKIIIVARTHSFIVGENLAKIQERIGEYTSAGADIICVHNTNYSWGNYQKMLRKLKVDRPLLIIVSRKKSLPKFIYNNRKIGYILYPNQLYRIMLYPVSRMGDYNPLQINMIGVNDIFNSIKKINDKK